MKTTRDLDTDTTVLISKPFVLVVHDKYYKQVCHNCFGYHGTKDLKISCEECKSAWYCSDACKDAQFSEYHHIECAFLKKYAKLSSDIPNETSLRIRTLIKLLVKRKLEIDDVDIKAMDGLKFEDVENLLAHDDDSDEGSYVLKKVKRIIDKKYLMSKEMSMLQLISRAECNQFGLWSEDDDLMGASLHPSASFFNHSCVPNCYSQWEGVNLVFKTLYPIAKGSEITISYIDAHTSTKKRREELLSSYHFLCDCPRCTGRDAIPKKAYDRFYKVHLKCPVGPGLMRLETDLNEIEEEDNIDIPIPQGYDVRTCMTCSFRRLSRPVPEINKYLSRINQINT